MIKTISILMITLFTLTGGHLQANNSEGQVTINQNVLEIDKDIEKEEQDNLIVADYDKSIWMWDVYDMTRETIEKLRNSNIKSAYINTGYVSKIKESFILNHKEEYSEFITNANESNIEVHALFGTPYWSLEEHYDYMQKQIDEVLEYNELYKDARFEAVHLDIEPHTLPSWREGEIEDRVSIMREYLSNLEKIKKSINNHNEKHDDNLKLSIDIAPVITEYRLFSDELFEAIDELVLMDYTKSKSFFIENALYYLRKGDFHKKDVSIGSEYKKEEEKISLYYKEKEDLQSYYKEAFTSFSKYSSFKYFAVHGFDDYFEVVEQRNKDINE